MLKLLARYLALLLILVHVIFWAMGDPCIVGKFSPLCVDPWSKSDIPGGIADLYLGWYVSSGFMDVVERARNAFRITTAAHPFAATTCRDLIASLPSVVARPAPNHSHPDAAAARNACAVSMQAYASLLGTELFMFQMSAADQKRGVHGSRVPYWDRDLAVQQRPMSPPPRCVIGMVDLDYYLDHDAFRRVIDSTPAPVPIVIATVQPRKAADTDGNVSYRFEADGTLHYVVAGGSVFEHEVWDYSPDTISFSYVRRMTFDQVHSFWDFLKWFWYLWPFGRDHRTVVYNVDRKIVHGNECQQLVFLTPSVSYRGIYYRGEAVGGISGFCARLYGVLFNGEQAPLLGRPLERLQPKYNDTYNLITELRPDGMSVSFAKIGEWTSTTVSRRLFDTVRTMFELNKNNLSAGSVVSANPHGENISREDAARLVACLRAGTGMSKYYVCTPLESTNRVQFGQPIEGKPMLKTFMPAMMTGGVVYDDVPNTEARAVNGRVLDIRAELATVDRTLMAQMLRFVELTAPAERLHPVSMEEVLDHRVRPTQRANDMRADLDEELDPTIKAFDKKEAYQTLGDPRMISPHSSGVTRRYARYLYALAPHFRAQPWYGPGRTPKELAQRVAEICTSARFAMLWDASRMDGRINTRARLLWCLFMMRAFREEYHPELSELLRSNMMQRVFTAHGHKYWSGLARSSGSAETTDANTYDTAFAYWMCAVAEGIDEIDALNKMNATGDDLIASDVSKETAEKYAGYADLKVEVEIIERGALGVNYLNRWFGPGVFNGETSSIINVPRALMKFHQCVALPAGMTEEDYAAIKARDYLYSDANTPLFGDIMTNISQCYQQCRGEIGSAHADNYFVNQYPPEEQWPNEYGDWMEELVERWLPDFDYWSFDLWLKACVRRPRLFMQPPLLVDRAVDNPKKITAFINGDCLEPSDSLRAIAEHIVVDDELEELDKRLEYQAAADCLSDIPKLIGITKYIGGDVPLVRAPKEEYTPYWMLNDEDWGWREYEPQPRHLVVIPIKEEPLEQAVPKKPGRFYL